MVSDLCSETQNVRYESIWPEWSNRDPCPQVPQRAGQTLSPLAEAQFLFHLLGEFLLCLLKPLPPPKKKAQSISLVFGLSLKLISPKLKGPQKLPETLMGVSGNGILHFFPRLLHFSDCRSAIVEKQTGPRKSQNTHKNRQVTNSGHT